MTPSTPDEEPLMVNGQTLRGHRNITVESGHDIDHVLLQLKIALRTVAFREQGPQAAHEARRNFGLLADTRMDNVTLTVDADRYLALHPDHQELHTLIRTLRDRGPAVGVTLTNPPPAQAHPA
ncbi:hypothetical protein [Streptomyces violascens]|uniref:hypothetical protein n=1 Tax=Streptomyces violascens TaxID=67381 RepID=UPI001673CDF5|nr:hypothetical protein [Streptomyces violascens]